MKKILLIFALIITFSLSSCDLFTTSNKYNNDNLSEVTPNEDKLFVVDDSLNYYESNDITLWAEINGHYISLDYFTLDSNNNNIRVYDNIYLYTDDYFYMISNDNVDWFADLKEETQYAAKELAEGEDYSIIIKRDGIYKIEFDLETKKFNVVFKEEIESAKYIKINGCEICQFINDKATYTKMIANPNNNDELMLLNYEINNGKSIYFYSIIHTSNYKIFINDDTLNIIAKYANKKRQGANILVDGPINIYLNTKTYAVRIEKASN